MMNTNRRTESSSISITSPINSCCTYAKATRVFGSLIAEQDHSLCYSPSPFHGMKAFNNITNTPRTDDVKRILPFGSIEVTPETKNKTSKKNENVTNISTNSKIIDYTRYQKENVRELNISNSKLQKESLKYNLEFVNPKIKKEKTGNNNNFKLKLRNDSSKSKRISSTRSLSIKTQNISSRSSSHTRLKEELIKKIERDVSTESVKKILSAASVEEKKKKFMSIQKDLT